MEKLQMDGTETFLLGAPESEEAKGTPRRILEVFFKQKVFIITAFLVVCLPVLITILLLPKKYIATSKVLIKPSQTFLNLSPTSADSSLWLSPSPETINSEIQIIRSRELLSRLAKEVPFPKANGRNGRESAWLLQARPLRASSIIEISIQSSNPEWASRVVNRASELYLEHHLKVYKTPGVQEFYDEQEKKLQMELVKAQMELKEYQEKEKIVDPAQQVSSMLATLAAAETNLRTTESSLRETTEKVRILEKQLKEQPENVSPKLIATFNPAYGQISQKITQLELERSNLLQRYTEKDRFVLDKEKEIAELKQRLALEEEKVARGEPISLSAIRQGILDVLLKERASLNALEAKRSSLLRDIANYSFGAAELKKKSFAYDRLQQEVNGKKEALSLYKKKSEEARISNAMDEQKFSNASILEKASLPLPRAGRALWIMVSLTILASIAVAVGGAFGIEFLNTTLRNEADVEEQIGLPVLATIQHYRLPERV